MEEYGQLVEEIEEATTLREILTRGVKHTSPAPHDTENEDGTEPEEVIDELFVDLKEQDADL